MATLIALPHGRLAREAPGGLADETWDIDVAGGYFEAKKYAWPGPVVLLWFTENGGGEVWGDDAYRVFILDAHTGKAVYDSHPHSGTASGKSDPVSTPDNEYVLRFTCLSESRCDGKFTFKMVACGCPSDMPEQVSKCEYPTNSLADAQPSICRDEQTSTSTRVTGYWKSIGSGEAFGVSLKVGTRTTTGKTISQAQSKNMATTVKLGFSFQVKLIDIEPEVSVTTGWSKTIENSITESITTIAERTTGASCDDGDTWFMWQWVMRQEPDKNGPGYISDTSNYSCTLSYQERPRCPLGFCAEKVESEYPQSACQRCLPPFEYLGIDGGDPPIPTPPPTVAPTPYFLPRYGQEAEGGWPVNVPVGQFQASDETAQFHGNVALHWMTYDGNFEVWDDDNYEVQVRDAVSNEVIYSSDHVGVASDVSDTIFAESGKYQVGIKCLGGGNTCEGDFRFKLLECGCPPQWKQMVAPCGIKFFDAKPALCEPSQRAQPAAVEIFQDLVAVERTKFKHYASGKYKGSVVLLWETYDDFTEVWSDDVYGVQIRDPDSNEVVYNSGGKQGPASGNSGMVGTPSGKYEVGLYCFGGGHGCEGSFKFKLVECGCPDERPRQVSPCQFQGRTIDQARPAFCLEGQLGEPGAVQGWDRQIVAKRGDFAEYASGAGSFVLLWETYDGNGEIWADDAYAVQIRDAIYGNVVHEKVHQGPAKGNFGKVTTPSGKYRVGVKCIGGGSQCEGQFKFKVVECGCPTSRPRQVAACEYVGRTVGSVKPVYCEELPEPIEPKATTLGYEILNEVFVEEKVQEPSGGLLIPLYVWPSITKNDDGVYECTSTDVSVSGGMLGTKDDAALILGTLSI